MPCRPRPKWGQSSSTLTTSADHQALATDTAAAVTLAVFDHILLQVLFRLLPQQSCVWTRTRRARACGKTGGGQEDQSSFSSTCPNHESGGQDEAGPCGQPRQQVGLAPLPQSWRWSGQTATYPASSASGRPVPRRRHRGAARGRSDCAFMSPLACCPTRPFRQAPLVTVVADTVRRKGLSAAETQRVLHWGRIHLSVRPQTAGPHIVKSSPGKHGWSRV